MEKILRGVKFFKQQGYELCWAACLEMVFHYFNPQTALTQADIVAQKYGLPVVADALDSKTKKFKPLYDKALSANEIIELSTFWDYSLKRHVNKEMYWAIIKAEINQNRPLIANIGFHYVVILGFSETIEGNYFFYNDPQKDSFRKRKLKNGDIINIEDEILTIH